MEIRWKRGAERKTPASVAQAEIERIAAKTGGSCSAEQLLDAAKQKKNPLHNEFEWDDTIAAHEHRLSTSRKIMQSLVIIRDDIPTDRPQRVYEIVREKPDPDKGSHQRIRHVYRSADDIMADPDLRAELIGRVLQDLIRIRNRFRDLQELAIVFRAIDEVVASQS